MFFYFFCSLSYRFEGSFIENIFLIIIDFYIKSVIFLFEYFIE